MNTLPDPPVDVVTSLKFSPRDQLLVTSWDNQIRLYDAESSNLLSSIQAPSTPLSTIFNSGTFHSGYIDGTVRSIDLENQSFSTIKLTSKKNDTLDEDHSVGVAHLMNQRPASNDPVLIGASWDGKVNVIDVRSNNIASTTQMPKKIFSMDTSDEYLVVGMSGRTIHIYDHRMNYSEPLQIRESGLKFQMKDLKCWEEGYALASIDGRVAIEYYDPSDSVQEKKYAFKCHRVPGVEEDVVFPVNSIQFKKNLLYTGGNDSVCVWNFQNRKRVKQYKVGAENGGGEVNKISVSDSGKYLGISSFDKDAHKSVLHLKTNEFGKR
ncbi:cell cycle arrest protein Bub3p [[Candida] railenensis]|uniref:Cell cycle arrest protein Bub3p n=1 Tax=[Candida] railenensis TaxID=45579 RepID=A0A9P0VWS2_9ASCO|nr:cell cycle arrest protein Bub3p [[Candida] railenensis]